MEEFKVSESGLFICNEGNFQYGNATLSYYDPTTMTVENEVFYRANAMKLGDPLDPQTQVGPVINEKAAKNITCCW